MFHEMFHEIFMKLFMEFNSDFFFGTYRVMVLMSPPLVSGGGIQ